ncbi:MAG TPA: murein biosynthesis integral membrane protein MurJ [Candidatus Saccharimonadales bacterium]|jgi:putative peptidoglycan lipid II flippase|nr:murein biosynthesis integral membrane protein MurJ [Candidatus Saccharimonadales bacterium]
MSKVQGIVARANRRLSVQLAATMLAGSSLASSLLGLFRDRLLMTNYYDTYKTGIDAYTVAFIIPDFMFFLLVSGALSVTFIPVFNERLSHGNKKSAWQLTSSLINLMALLTFVASILIIIFADPLVKYVVGPGLDEAGHGLAVSMMRVIAINPFLFAISSVIASMQQAVGRFFFFALAPMIYNLGIILGITVLANGITIFGVTIFEGGIMGVALGVVIGSVLQLVISSIGLIGLGFDYEFKIFWKNKGFRQVLKLLPPRSIDQGIDYFNTIVESNLATRLGNGVVTAYNRATTLHMMPVTLIGVAISTAAFPKMTERLGQGRPDLFRKELQSVLRVIIWLSLPAAILVFLCRGYIVSFIKNGGETTIASILGILAVAILFRSIYHIASRSFYAQQDTRTPLYISFFTIGLNIALAIYLGRLETLGIIGLAMAQSIVAFVEVVILFSIMQYRIRGLFDMYFVRAVARMLAAGGLMFIVTYISIQIFPLQASDQSFLSVFPKFILICIISAISYVAISWLFKLTEAKPVVERIVRLVFKQYRPPEVP